MLNLDFWDFYVLPTYRIDNDPSLSSQKTISLGRLKRMRLEKIGFNELANGIYTCIDDISTHYNKANARE